MATLCDRIKTRRLELKLTQKAIGDSIGVSSVAVTQWESGETAPKGANLIALAESLQCEAVWLVNGVDPIDIGDTLASRIKICRTALNLSQEELGEAVGVSQNAIHKLEDGTTDNPRKIIELAKTLNCSPEWLLNGDIETGKKPTNPLAVNIKARMCVMGLTQNELATKVGMSQVNVHRLLTGKVIQTVKIFELADALNCHPRWLSGNTSKAQPASSGERIKARRKALQLTQTDVANFIGTTKASVSMWENGQTEANGKNLTKLTEILQCSPQALLNENDSTYQTNTSSYHLAQYQRLLEAELAQEIGFNDPQGKQLLHYFSRCSDKDKALILQIAKHHSV